MPSPLLIGSCEPFSGKSAVVLGLAQQLRRKGVSFSFGKPLATCLEPEGIHQPGDPLLDADVRFIGAPSARPSSGAGTAVVPNSSPSATA
ncbi:MAG: hypothetical protein ACKOOH_07085, partial [Cyanobium sp.]